MAAFPLAALACACLPALPASLSVLLTDSSGAPLEDAIAWATPKVPVQRPIRTAAVQQINKTFVPLVTVVQAGAVVAFPNRDEIRHHIYSFSPTKIFEIKLYAGTPVPPTMTFDKAGEVVLGCNIHDTMLGYIYVVDSPFYGKAAADGRVKLDNLPEGEYELHAWHYAQAAAPEARAVKLRGDENATAELAMTLRPRMARPPTR